MGIVRREGANRRRAGALRSDWTKRGRVWILPFVAKLHNGKSIGAGRAAAGRRAPPGTPRPAPAAPAASRPAPSPTESAFPGGWCGGAWRGAASGEGRARPRGRPGEVRGGGEPIPPLTARHRHPRERQRAGRGERRPSGKAREALFGGGSLGARVSSRPVPTPRRAPERRRGRVKPLAREAAPAAPAAGLVGFCHCSSLGTLVTGLGWSLLACDPPQKKKVRESLTRGPGKATVGRGGHSGVKVAPLCAAVPQIPPTLWVAFKLQR